MTLVQALIWYPVVFIIMICIIVCAVLAGKKLRDRKDAKTGENKSID